MSVRRLAFFFDYISHNAYLAWTQIHAPADRHGVGVTPVPVVFGAMLRANAQLGPAEIPAKRAWMLRDVLRKAARLGVPFAPPAAHPFNPLCALRATLAIESAAERRRAIDALFAATWARSLDVAQPSTVARVLDECGLDGEALVGRAGDDDIKQALRASTDAALALGVFGVPSIEIDAEVFFGLDDFGHLEAFLSGRDPLDRAVLDDWLAVPEGVRRRH